MSKRSIRLKEFIPLSRKVHYPIKVYPVPNEQLSDREGYYQSANSEGNMEYPGFPDDIQSKMVFLGDSFIENMFVKESCRVLNLLQEKLIINNSSVKIYNCAVSGSTSLGLLNSYINKVLPLKPDYLVYIQPSCDFTALSYKNGYYNSSKYFSNIIPTSTDEDTYYDTIYNNLHQLEHNIKLLAHSCNYYNITLIIATCCSMSSKRQLLWMNSIVRKLSEECNYKVIDLDVLMEKSSRYFYDKQHLNIRGSRKLSEIIYREISELPFIASDYFLSRNTLLSDKLYTKSFEVALEVGTGYCSGNIFIELDHLGRSSVKNILLTQDIKIEVSYFCDRNCVYQESFIIDHLLYSKVEYSHTLYSNLLNITHIKINFKGDIFYDDFFIRYIKSNIFYKNTSEL